MAEIINLNRARKAALRVKKTAAAAANRAKFGRTGPEKQADVREKARADRRLDDSKLS